MFKKAFGLLLAALTASYLKPLTTAEQVKHNFINPHANGHFRFFGNTNGASRKRKTNRLHLSVKTRNKHR